MPRETELLSNPVFIGIDFASRGFLVSPFLPHGGRGFYVLALGVLQGEIPIISGFCSEIPQKQNKGD